MPIGEKVELYDVFLCEVDVEAFAYMLELTSALEVAGSAKSIFRQCSLAA